MSVYREFSKVCQESKKRLWVYLIVVFIASFSSYVTWLTLDTAGVPSGSNKWWSGGVFILVAIILLLYFISCMRRYSSQGHSFAD
jgi:hypothetical protein